MRLTMLMRGSHIAAFAAGVLGSGILLNAQSRQAQPPQESTPTFRSAIQAVPITVIVTDANGNPVTGLSRDDFEILEDGAPQPITTFSFVDVSTERTERSGAVSDVLSNDRPPGRLYLIALDSMRPELALRTRFFLRQFIEKHFTPNDTAAVVLTTGGLSTSGQDFTSNPRLLLAAIDRFDGGAEAGGASRERSFNGSLRDLTELVARLPGPRKAMILVSGRIAENADDVVGYKPGRFGGLFSPIDSDFHRALSAATRGNITIYPINPAGLTTDLPAPGSFDTSRMEDRGRLQALAEITGGFVVDNTNNYETAFERLVSENSTYYLLGFNSPSDRRDGRYLRLEVRVKRPGLRVRAPGGYLAPMDPPPAPKRPATVLAAVWDAVASPLTTSGVPMRLFAAPFRGPGKDATVVIALEMTASTLNLVEQDGAFRGDVDIVLAVTAASKKRYPPMRHRAVLALKPATYERVGKGAIRVITQWALPKGRYQMRVSAGSAALAGSVVYDVDVPDFADDLAMSGVALTSTQASETFTAIPDRRLDVALPGPPTTAREFSSDDMLTLFTEVYENRRRPHTITFTTELRDASGGVVGTSEVQRQATEKPAGPSVHAFSPRVSLNDLQPGRYVLRVEARSTLDRSSSVSREVAFVVR
jgi:VWFA-related protein